MKHSMVGWMDSKQGTPKTLDEALKNGLDQCMIGWSAEDIAVIHANLQDFLSQKFTHSAHVSDEKHEAIIIDLFKTVTKRESI